jgi:hypothetical protein
MNNTQQVDAQINSVNFICNWKYNVQSESMKCCICGEHSLKEYIPTSQRNCTIKVHGVVVGKCGHIAHLSCYKRKNRQQNNVCLDCNILFEFDKNLEENHTQKLYKV